MQNSLLPPSQRCRDQTDKEPTGPFDRAHLQDYLEKKAKTEKDWDQNKPYIKEQKGDNAEIITDSYCLSIPLAIILSF